MPKHKDQITRVSLMHPAAKHAAHLSSRLRHLEVHLLIAKQKLRQLKGLPPNLDFEEVKAAMEAKSAGYAQQKHPASKGKHQDQPKPAQSKGGTAGETGDGDTDNSDTAAKTSAGEKGDAVAAKGQQRAPAQGHAQQTAAAPDNSHEDGGASGAKAQRQLEQHKQAAGKPQQQALSRHDAANVQEEKEESGEVEKSGEKGEDTGETATKRAKSGQQ